MALLGSLTDVLPGLLQIRFPGMAAFFAILPILTICRQVNQTDSAQPAPPNQDEVILNSSHGAKSVYLVLSAYFFMESQLNLISQSFPKGGTNLHAALIFSGLLVLGGLAALTFRRFPWDDGLKELALSLLFAATIPVIVFAFWKFGSTTVWAIILLARNLNIGIIAEGVETDTQLRFLKGRLCDEAQGFYYFHPMPAGEVTKYLRGSSGPSAGK